MICPNCGENFPDVEERLEGLDEIRRFIDPKMGVTRFSKDHRKPLEPYIMYYTQWFRRTRADRHKKKPKIFSFKRLILAYMIKQKRL